MYSDCYAKTKKNRLENNKSAQRNIQAINKMCKKYSLFMTEIH